jgi:hypothetical protein
MTAREFQQVFGKRIRKPPSDTEHREQTELFRWIQSHLDAFPHWKFIFAVPNGGKRGKITAVRLKAEGVKAGVPDICVPFPRGSYHGMYIEMKSVEGRLTATQRLYSDFLKEQGYRHVVCRSAREAKDALITYEQLLEFDPNTPKLLH